MSELTATSDLESQIVMSAYRHRLLSTTQIHQLHTPGASRRWTQHVLARLAAAGYLARTRKRGQAGGGRQGESLWFMTDMGAAATVGAEVAERWYQMNVARAVGPLQAHTLATNDAGLAFVSAARRLGHECSPADWDHEVAFRTADRPTGGPGSDLLVADAVLHYAIRWPAGDELLTRFVEIDRGTESVQRLAAKLRAYAALYLYRPRAGKDDPGPRLAGWRNQFLAFPKVLVILCGRSPEQLARRREHLLALCRLDPLLDKLSSQVTVSVTTLEALQNRGPFAPVFFQPFTDGPVDVVGESEGGAPDSSDGALTVGGDPEQGTVGGQLRLIGSRP